MFPMVDSVSPASFKSGLTVADIAYYKDGAGAWTSLAITDTATEIASTGMYTVELTAAELNHDLIMIKMTGSGAADSGIIIRTFDVDIEDLVRSTTPANTFDVAATGEGGIDFSNSKGTHPTVPIVTDITNDVGITQAAADKVWSSAARTLTSFGTLVADIWAYATRTLTAGTKDSEIDAIKAKTDNLPVDPADQSALEAEHSNLYSAIQNIPGEIWTITPRTLSSFGTLVADVADQVWNELISEHTGETTFGGKNQKIIPSETIGDYKADVSTLSTASALSTHDGKLDTANTNIDALILSMSRVLGLTYENSYMHSRVYSAGKVTSVKLDSYDSKANANSHDGSTGIVAKYTQTMTYSGDTLSTFKMVKDS